MPCLHPHPKILLPLPFAPFFGSYRPFLLSAMPSRLCRFFAALQYAHVRLRSDSWGAQSMRLRPLYNHHYYHLLFGEMGKGRPCPVATLHNSHQSRLCPPIPFHQTLKEGCGRGWGGGAGRQSRDPREEPKAPHRVDPYPVHVCSSSSVCVYIYRSRWLIAILAQVWCPPPKSEKGSTIRVGQWGRERPWTTASGLYHRRSPLRVLSNSFTLLHYSDKVRHKDILGRSSARLFCHILGSEFGTLYPPFCGEF